MGDIGEEGPEIEVLPVRRDREAPARPAPAAPERPAAPTPDREPQPA